MAMTAEQYIAADTCTKADFMRFNAISSSTYDRWTTPQVKKGKLVPAKVPTFQMDGRKRVNLVKWREMLKAQAADYL